jgi:rhamnulokinase
VVAGPVEATALGNILVQGRAAGWIAGDLDSLRGRIRDAQPLRRYEPGRAPAMS